MLRTMYEARRNKRYGRDCSDFERVWAPGLVRMMGRLQERTFRVDHNYAFLTSIPRWREIFATSFEGRLADHLLRDTLAPYIEQELHCRTFNNRKGMGNQAAINRVIQDIYEVSEGYTQPCRVMKWDLKGFFPNAWCDEIERRFVEVIDRHAEDIVRRFDDEMPNFLKWLTMICVHCNPAQHCELRTPRYLWDKHIAPEKSLFSKPAGIGTPIGRLTSQMGMGLYLNAVVHWLNDECGIRSTLFMDDCVMVVSEFQHEYALALMPELRRRLAAIGIRLNERKFYDQPYQHGLEFLGVHIKPWRIHLNNNTYNRALARIGEFNALDDKWRHIDSFISSINSYTGQLKACTDHKRIIRLYEAISPEWWHYCWWDEDRCCINALPAYSLKARLSKKYHLHLKTNNHDKRRNQTGAGSPVSANHRFARTA